MNTSIRRAAALIAALLLSSAAYTQKPEPYFGPPPADGAKQPAAAPAALGTDPLADIKRALAAWPETRAHQAVQTLVSRGTAGIPGTLTLLTSNDWRIRAGAVTALGEIGDKATFDAVRAGLDDVSNLIAIDIWLRSLVRIDAVRGTADVLPYLKSPSKRTADAALQALPRSIDPKFESEVAALLGEDDDELRRRGVLLTQRLTGAPRDEVYFAHLGDRSSKVARAAADALVASSDESVLARLNDLAGGGALREACYAALALVRAEDVSGRKRLVVDEERIDRWFKWLRMRSEFENATGAIVLAQVSRASDSARVREAADRVLPPALIRGAFGGVIFADYSAVRDLCVRKLEQITGRSLGDNGVKWKDWWTAEGASFVAERDILSFTGTDPALVRLGAVLADGRRGTLLSSAGAAHDGLARIVAAESIAELLSRIEAAGFFTPDAEGAVDGDETGEISVVIGRRTLRRALTAASPGDLRRAADAICTRAEELKWQAFAPPSARGLGFAEWAGAVAAELEALAPAERSERAAKLALTAYPMLDGAARAAALDAIQSRSGSWISANRAAITHVLGLKSIAPAEAIQLAGVLGRAEPPPDPADLLLFFLARGESFAAVWRPLLPAIATAGLVELAADQREWVFVPAIEALTLRMNDPLALDALAAQLKSPSARRGDLLLDALKDKDAAPLLPGIQAIAADAYSPVRMRAIEAHTYLAGDARLDQLVDGYMFENEFTRRAVLRGLARLGTPKARDAVFALLERDVPVAVRHEVLGAAGEFGDEDGRARMTRYMKAETNEGHVLAALPTFVGVFGREAGPAVAPFLEHSSRDVRQRAALLLGARALKEAVPALVLLLEGHELGAAAREYLELTTCLVVDSAQTDVARDRYQAFWEANKESSQYEWFLSALRDASAFTADLEDAEVLSARRVSALIAILRNERWYLRANANLLLIDARGGGFGYLNARSTLDDASRLASRFREWLAERE